MAKRNKAEAHGPMWGEYAERTSRKEVVEEYMRDIKGSNMKLRCCVAQGDRRMSDRQWKEMRENDDLQIELDVASEWDQLVRLELRLGSRQISDDESRFTFSAGR